MKIWKSLVTKPDLRSKLFETIGDGVVPFIWLQTQTFRIKISTNGAAHARTKNKINARPGRPC